MPELFGRASFPGVEQVLSCSYVLSHGITPGTATLDIVPQTDFIAAGGTLTIFDGAVTLVFAGCKVDQSSIRLSSGGFVTSLTIFDRRWKWAFGSLSGSYNIRKEDGNIDPARLQTPQQLATLALLAMGETGFDVSQVPNSYFPLVEWDHENPAQALADLAQKLGCRVVLRLDGTVLVARTGFGAELPRPRADILEDSLTINPPERPDGITFVCAPSRFQVDFVLEPVGEDMDGKIKHITDLSYKPEDGWKGTIPPDFIDISDTPVGILNRVPRDLARATVYRWYRIRMRDVADQTQDVLIPGYGRVENLERILPIEEELVQTYIDPVSGNEKRFPAEVEGDFFDGNPPFVENRENARYPRDFSIDAAKGIVKFSEPVVQFDAAGFWVPADLILRTAVSVRDRITWALHRFERTFLFPGARFGTGTQQLRQEDEIALMIFPTYNAAGQVIRLTSNAADVIRQADQALAAAVVAYQTPLPQEIAYAGLKAISPDGAIQQVAWSVGPSGCTTRASRNDEFAITTLAYPERRAQERLRGDFLQRLQQQLARAQQERRGRKRA